MPEGDNLRDALLPERSGQRRLHAVKAPDHQQFGRVDGREVHRGNHFSGVRVGLGDVGDLAEG